MSVCVCPRCLPAFNVQRRRRSRRRSLTFLISNDEAETFSWAKANNKHAQLDRVFSPSFSHEQTENVKLQVQILQDVKPLWTLFTDLNHSSYFYCKPFDFPAKACNMLL